MKAGHLLHGALDIHVGRYVTRIYSLCMQSACRQTSRVPRHNYWRRETLLDGHSCSSWRNRHIISAHKLLMN